MDEVWPFIRQCYAHTATDDRATVSIATPVDGSNYVLMLRAADDTINEHATRPSSCRTSWHALSTDIPGVFACVRVRMTVKHALLFSPRAMFIKRNNGSMSGPIRVRKLQGAEVRRKWSRDEAHLDDFYTPHKLLHEVVTEWLPRLGPNDVFVDFSAGDGALGALIRRHYPGTVTYEVDLKPRPCPISLRPPGEEPVTKVIEKDWFTVRRSDLPACKEGGRLVCGFNPPFGYRGKVAREFVAHAAKTIQADELVLLMPPKQNGKLNATGVAGDVTGYGCQRSEMRRVTFMRTQVTSPQIPPNTKAAKQTAKLSVKVHLQHWRRGVPHSPAHVPKIYTSIHETILAKTFDAKHAPVKWYEDPGHVWVCNAGTNSGVSAFFVHGDAKQLWYLYADDPAPRTTKRPAALAVEDRATGNITGIVLPNRTTGDAWTLPRAQLFLNAIAVEARAFKARTGQCSCPGRLLASVPFPPAPAAVPARGTAPSLDGGEDRPI